MKENVELWDTETVCQWLSANNLDSITPIFRRNKVYIELPRTLCLCLRVDPRLPLALDHLFDFRLYHDCSFLFTLLTARFAARHCQAFATMT